MTPAVPSFLRGKPCGCMVAVGDKTTLDLFIREETWGMKKYPNRFPIEMRLLKWDDDRVLLVALLVRLNSNDHTTLDYWINAGEPSGIRLLQATAAHNTIGLHFADSQVLRSIRTGNTVRADAAEILASPAVLRSWTPEAFRAGRDQINTLYPTASALWWAHPAGRTQRPAHSRT